MLISAFTVWCMYFINKQEKHSYTTTCSTILIVVFPLIISKFSDNYGLSGDFIFFIYINIIAVILALIFKLKLPKSTEISLIARIKESFGSEVLKNGNFLIANIFGCLVYGIPRINILTY